MDAGETNSTGFAQLLARFRGLNAALQRFAGLTGTDLIDAIFPPNVQWAFPLREVLSGAPVDAFTIPDEVMKIVRDYVTQPEVPTHPNFVRVMSLHASKGLTAEVAIVAGVVHTAVPFVDRTATPEKAAQILEEQRRLFYVAITRGRQILLLSSAARIPAADAFNMNISVGQNDRTYPSQFLRETGNRRAVIGTDWAAAGCP
jgi:superfamily I DNA/RNA helicase